MTEILQHLKTSRGRYFAAVPCAKEKEEKKIRQQNHQTNKKRYKQRQQYLDQYIKSVQVDLSCILLFPFFNFKKN